jgi:hypothetical protein
VNVFKNRNAMRSNAAAISEVTQMVIRVVRKIAEEAQDVQAFRDAIAKGAQAGDLDVAFNRFKAINAALADYIKTGRRPQ